MPRTDGTASKSSGRTQAAISTVRSPRHSRSRAWPLPAPLPLRSADRENDGQNRSAHKRFGRDEAKYRPRSRQTRAVTRSGPGHGALGTVRRPLVSPGGRGCPRRVRRLRLRSKWCAGRSRRPHRAKDNPRLDCNGCRCRYRIEGGRPEVESSSLCRGAVEKVHQTAALPQAPQGLKTSFHGKAFVDDKPHSF